MLHIFRLQLRLALHVLYVSRLLCSMDKAVKFDNAGLDLARVLDT